MADGTSDNLSLQLLPKLYSRGPKSRMRFLLRMFSQININNYMACATLSLLTTCRKRVASSCLQPSCLKMRKMTACRVGPASNLEHAMVQKECDRTTTKEDPSSCGKKRLSIGRICAFCRVSFCGWVSRLWRPVLSLLSSLGFG